MREKQPKQRGKQSICPAEADGTTTGTQPDSASTGPADNDPKFFAPNLDQSGTQMDEELLPFSKADLIAAVEELYHIYYAEAIGRTAEYENEKCSPGFVEARLRWIASCKRDCERQEGESVSLVWIRTTQEVFHDIVWAKFCGSFAPIRESPLLRIENPATVEEWHASLMSIAKNPLLTKDEIFTRNAPALNRAALVGRQDLFAKHAQGFRSDRKSSRLGAGTGKGWFLRLWLPAGLWTLGYTRGARRLSEALERMKALLRKNPHPAAQIMADGCSVVGEQAYRKAVTAHGLLMPK